MKSSDDKRNPVINLDKCIRCYCCSKYCTAGAIKLHGGIINHIIRAASYVMKI